MSRGMFASSRSRTLLAWLPLAALYFVALAWACVGGLIGDEWVHVPQIQRFAQGDFTVDQRYLTTVPGYHALSASWLWLSHTGSLGSIRLFNALLGIATVVVFHRLRQCSGNADAGLATAQFLVLPVLFPFFFLAYTDVLSLGLVLAATAATLSSRHKSAALLLLFALAVRQNNVVWTGLLAVLAAWQQVWLRDGLDWRAIIRSCWPYATNGFLFAGFWLWNGSISLSSAQVDAHPDLSLHTGNVFFSLFLIGLLLPLQLAQGVRAAARFALQRPWLLLLPLALFTLYWWSFSVDHPYNLIDPRWSLRNRLLQAVAADPWWRVAFGLVVVASACGLTGIRLRPSSASWIFPCALVFLAASWLIETRYVLIPLALWLAFREHGPVVIERVTVVVWALLSFLVFFVLMYGGPFL